MNNFAVDENNLDKEWIGLEALYDTHSCASALARKRMDVAKSRLAVAQATAAQNIRKNPAGHGVDKVTESSVTTAVALDKAVIEANDAVIEARYEYDIADAAVRRVEIKKDTLEHLVKMIAMGYYSVGDNCDLQKKISTRLMQNRVAQSTE